MVVIIVIAGLVIFLAVLPKGRGSGRGLAAPPVTTTTTPVPTTVAPGLQRDLPDPEGVLLDAPLELLVADGRGLRTIDLQTGEEWLAETSPDLRSVTDLGSMLVVVEAGQARVAGIVEGEAIVLGGAQTLLGSDIPGRLWLVDEGVITEVEADGGVTRGPYPLPEGLVPRRSTRDWLIGDGEAGVVGVSTAEGRVTELASGQLLTARGDTLVWTDCGDGQADPCATMVTDLRSGTDRFLDVPEGTDLLLGAISPDERWLALSGFDTDDLPALILIDYSANDEITIVPTETQPDWYDISEPWSPDGSLMVWRAFDDAETLWAHRIGEDRVDQIAVAVRGEVNDAILRTRR